MLSVIVIGSGPAGHTACIYLSRANLKPLMLEGDSQGLVVAGGLLTTTKTVENYPGFPNGVEGMELTNNFREQSLKYGTSILSETVVSLNKQDDNSFVVTTKEHDYKCKSIIIATGSTPKRLYIPGYDTFWQKGISTCAVCDGGLPCFRKKPLAVVGGGDSACEEALHLAHTASHVYLIHRRATLRASQIMTRRVLSHPKITMIWNSEVGEIKGEEDVETLILNHLQTKQTSELKVNGLFVAIGHTPNTEFLKGIVELDNEGYIVTARDMKTNIEGIWAAGDVQDHKYRQAITAAGSGCTAALEVERWLSLQ
jgi:thioredoxin reductase (NADPH)